MKIKKSNLMAKTLFESIRQHDKSDPLVFTDGNDFFALDGVAQGFLTLTVSSGGGLSYIIHLKKIDKSEYKNVFCDTSARSLDFFKGK